MLPRDKSRPLVVDDRSYRWLVSPVSDYKAKLVIQRSTGGGRRLEVTLTVECEGLVWLHDGESSTASPVTSYWAAVYIRRAQARGWDPESPGTPFIWGADAPP